MSEKRRARWSAVIILALFALFFLFLTPKVIHVRELQGRSDRLTQEIRRLKRQNATLESELKALREDPVYLERVAREKFNKAKEGEIVYKVVRERS
ncbi:MAG: hypothetical protein A3D28_02610 [Omnitrophica bacterium RIFCSPHIGHO2_02_FULL_63_14]|nr:MAG: hypothetical protein A3D28_02610 [Omnitrophica bacterium RIFCSPHIGHO2_02_FULL_63_14]